MCETVAAVSIASAIGYIPILDGKIYKMCNDSKYKPYNWNENWFNLYLQSRYSDAYIMSSVYTKYSLNQCCLEGREGKKIGWCNDVCRCWGGDNEGVVEVVACRLRKSADVEDDNE